MLEYQRVKVNLKAALYVPIDDGHAQDCAPKKKGLVPSAATPLLQIELVISLVLLHHLPIILAVHILTPESLK